MANPQCPGNGFSPRCSLRSRGLDRWFVLGGVLLSRTLAGAVPSALSGLASGFGMDTGRFPVAVTTETTTWAVRDDRHLWCGYSVIRVAACRPALTHARGVVRVLVVWVGCGPYSGRFAFTVLLTPSGIRPVVGVLLFVSAY